MVFIHFVPTGAPLTGESPHSLSSVTKKTAIWEHFEVADFGVFGAGKPLALPAKNCLSPLSPPCLLYTSPSPRD